MASAIYKFVNMKNQFTIVNPDGTETLLSQNSPISQAHRALSIAAERMGKSGYAAHLASKFAKRPYTPSAEHVQIVEAMPALLAGQITPEEAMGLLHQYDTMKQRLA
jgi:hypothetical protein